VVLKDLTELETLNLEDTNITDWSPVDHIENVTGRPDDWPIAGGGKA
jgi:hypothetical protein